MGLNYAAITATVLSGMAISDAEWPGVFERLRLMEKVALGVLRKKK